MSRRISIELDDVIVIANGDSSWDSAAERERGSVSRLAQIASSRSWEIIFLTQHRRPTRATEQVDAQQWLEARGFALPCVYVTAGSRADIATALNLDLVIESRPESCVAVVTESDARTILIWPAERAVLPADARRPEINTARTFAECLDMLTSVEDPRPKRESMFAWLRRLLGLKTANA